MFRKRVKDESLGAPDLVTTVKVESLRDQKEVFLPFEEECSSFTDLGVGGVPKEVSSRSLDVQDISLL